MTIKKSLISVAASAAIIAAVTGCSSDSTTTQPLTGATSSVTAVDGYIINATATAHYYDDSNNTVTGTMTSTLATADSVDSTKNTLGAADYKMSDDTNKSRVRYFKLVPKLIALSGTTTTPATFIDDGSVTGAFDLNDTAVNAAAIFYAPAGSSVITPITSLVFQQAGGVAGIAPSAANGADLNSTKIANAYAAVAAKLGLDVATIRDIDPTNDTTKTPEYALMNTMLAQAINENKLAAFTTALAAEANATSATTFTQTITKLQTAATASLTTNPFTAVLADIAVLGEAAYKAAIPSLNLDDTLTNGGVATYKAASATAIASARTAVAGTVDVWTLTSAGDKVGSTTGKDIAITFAAPEANATSTASLLVQITGISSYNAAPGNASEITIKVSDLNLSTIKTTTVALDETANTKFSFGVQETNTTGNYYKAFADVNATAANIADFITSTGLTTTIKLDTLLRAIDTNSTGATSLGATAGFDFTKISTIKVALVDGGKLQRVSSTNSNQRQAWGTTSVASIADSSNANLSGSGLTLLNLKADGRTLTTTSALNAAPNYDLNVTTANGLLTTAGVAVTTVDYNGSTVVMNVDTTAADKNITLGFGKNDADATEMLNTFTLSTASGILTAIGAVTDGANASDVNGTAAGKVNITLDSNSSLTTPSGSHPEFVFKYTPKDEFTKAGTERNVTIQLNRAPSADFNATGTVVYTVDKSASELNVSNGTINTMITAAVTNNANGIVLMASDIDGSSDVNNTSGLDYNVTKVTCTKATATNNVLVGTTLGTAGTNQSFTITGNDGNTTVLGFVLNTGSTAQYLELNSTVPANWTTSDTCNFQVSFYDRFGLDANVSKEISVTIQP